MTGKIVAISAGAISTVGMCITCCTVCAGDLRTDTGLTVHLCQRCHMDLHDHGVMDAELQELAQNVFEDRYGHAEFMQVFGKNFRRMDNETDY